MGAFFQRMTIKFSANNNVTNPGRYSIRNETVSCPLLVLSAVLLVEVLM